MEQDNHTAPFEGPEKLLEIWFATSIGSICDALCTNCRCGLRKVRRQSWEAMLDIVKCKVLSVVEGDEMDAYLLSESSMFISPHRLILKTCGTTLNLLGLPRILEIACDEAQLPTVHRFFYSRKSFMFPERQLGPHRDWKYEVNFLDSIFPDGAAYTVGKMNGDHWLLYLTSAERANAPTSPPTPKRVSEQAQDLVFNGAPTVVTSLSVPDHTLEILMTYLDPDALASFFTTEPSEHNPATAGLALSSSIGLADLFPAHLTTLDAYSFTPCGYSSNALIKWSHGPSNTDEKERYYSIHVTPEEGWSYASFECNVPISPVESSDPDAMPDLKTLVQRVVDIFRPGKLTLTLFVSFDSEKDDGGETPVEAAQRAFKAALTRPSPTDSPITPKKTGFHAKTYKRTDKINYEFGGYELAFASFERT